METSIEEKKYETFYSLKTKIEYLHETLSKFTKEKDNLDMILSNQRALYNKEDLRYQAIMLSIL